MNILGMIQIHYMIYKMQYSLVLSKDEVELNFTKNKKIYDTVKIDDYGKNIM